ncbi:MAG: hypothetical protein K8F91_15725 [Candidatus Obscuribacterales bacterium]|nr:hypothetical protein [Candidatus Obscuribacterales bacterium]
MKSRKLGALVALIAVLGTAMPAMAEEEPLEMVTQGSLMFTRVGAMGAGLVIGTPIAVIRESVKTSIDFTNSAADKVGEKTGGKENGPTVLVCSLVTVPVGIVVGSLKGLYYGTKNGVVTGFNQPFHPDSFSVGELEGE